MQLLFTIQLPRVIQTIWIIKRLVSRFHWLILHASPTVLQHVRIAAYHAIEGAEELKKECWVSKRKAASLSPDTSFANAAKLQLIKCCNVGIRHSISPRDLDSTGRMKPPRDLIGRGSMHP